MLVCSEKICAYLLAESREPPTTIVFGQIIDRSVSSRHHPPA